MRPRSIQSVPGLDPNGTPFDRLKRLTRLIVRIPKSEADKHTAKSGLVKARTSRKEAKGNLHD
jgi:hypothetical protein